jgi:hypothetical protein
VGNKCLFKSESSFLGSFSLQLSGVESKGVYNHLLLILGGPNNCFISIKEFSLEWELMSINGFHIPRYLCWITERGGESVIA